MTGFAKGMAVAVALAFSSQAFARGAAPAAPATKAGGPLGGLRRRSTRAKPLEPSSPREVPMKAFLVTLVVLATSLSARAEDPVDPRDRAVANLGRLNGIALNCRAKAETDRFRKAVIDVAPKLREIGETFEKATDASFREAVGKPCPLPEALRMEGDAAVERLKKVFAETR
jgi:hypothetical protein